jgi:hypothetical protein
MANACHSSSDSDFKLSVAKRGGSSKSGAVQSGIGRVSEREWRNEIGRRMMMSEEG